MLDIWFRREIDVLLPTLKSETIDIILDSLYLTKNISYEAERLLGVIAKHSPDKVLKLFKRRIDAGIDLRKEGYSPVPFEFFSLKDVLSAFPDEVLIEVLSWYTANDIMFEFTGAKLLHNIFPDFPENLQNSLGQFIKTGDKSKIEFVISVLRNYQGNPAIIPLCMQIADVLPLDDKLVHMAASAIWNTGIVSGAYGIADAYQSKIHYLDNLKENASEDVLKFIEDLQAGLSRQMINERERIKERIKLDKFKYGEDPEA